MFRLQTFGGLALVDAAGAPLPLRRRQLALLAMLAAAADPGLSRDKLVARFWSESPPEKARHALEQLLYSVRRQFPPEGPINGVDPVRLDRSIVESDVHEFERALIRKELGEAVGLYRGPFLDGFYLTDPGFDEWLEAERQRLAAAYAEALHRLAKGAGAEHHHTEAIAWWGRLAAIDPLSERSALGLARSMADAGDTASALRQARTYAARAREELGVPPTPEHIMFMRQLQTTVELPRQTERPPVGLSDRYRIERELGRGSVATVHLAMDLRHNRRVAVKLLRPELAGSIEGKRFLREISIAASLCHPHIIQLYDSGVSGGAASTPYYVMPFIEGESLRDRLAREGPLPVETAVRIAVAIAGALAYAHDRGIVHRDIKPENVLVQGWHALVADFGIARALESTGGELLSRSGVVLGTPAYMSPEQAVGGAVVDARADIYGLGCVLYEMLAGDPPFTGRTAQAVMARHALDTVPPLRTVCPGVSEALEKAILTALEKSPERRYQSAELFGRALAASPA